MAPKPSPLNHYALFLDVDGTLLELAPRPDGVYVPRPLLSLLDRLQELFQGALALISGRSLDSLDALFAPLELPAAGIHGVQRRDHSGIYHEPAGSMAWRDLLQPPLTAFAHAHPGLLLEDKGHALALHYRGAPALAAEVERLAETLLAQFADEIRLLRGKMVHEFLPAGHDKGAALRQFLAEPPFSGRRPLYIGDDVTDEAAFAVANALDGISIRVGPSASSHARYRLPDVTAVHDWLSALTTCTTHARKENL